MIDDETDGFVPGMIAGVIITLFLLVILFSIFGTTSEHIKELGQAICEEEYNQDFKSYSNNAELKCKPKETKNETLYDGIVIQVGGG